VSRQLFSGEDKVVVAMTAEVTQAIFAAIDKQLDRVHVVIGKPCSADFILVDNVYWIKLARLGVLINWPRFQQNLGLKAFLESFPQIYSLRLEPGRTNLYILRRVSVDGTRIITYGDEFLHESQLSPKDFNERKIDLAKDAVNQIQNLFTVNRDVLLKGWMRLEQLALQMQWKKIYFDQLGSLKEFVSNYKDKFLIDVTRPTVSPCLISLKGLTELSSAVVNRQELKAIGAITNVMSAFQFAGHANETNGEYVFFDNRPWMLVKRLAALSYWTEKFFKVLGDLGSFLDNHKEDFEVCVHNNELLVRFSDAPSKAFAGHKVEQPDDNAANLIPFESLLDKVCPNFVDTVARYDVQNVINIVQNLKAPPENLGGHDANLLDDQDYIKPPQPGKQNIYYIKPSQPVKRHIPTVQTTKSCQLVMSFKDFVTAFEKLQSILDVIDSIQGVVKIAEDCHQQVS
jgi:hypothetical protein